MNFLNFPNRVLYSGLLTLVVISSCEPKKTVLKSPPHYNFQEVYTNKLDLRIKEISGLVWENTRNEFIAHNDEAGKLFYLDRDSKEIKREVVFGGTGDYEDIALVGTIPYILRSDGTIFRIRPDSANSNTVKGEEMGKPGIEGSVDFEAMYYDSTRHALIMICKNCKVDNKATVSAFAYYVDSARFGNKPVFTIDASKVEELSPTETSKLQPSAARINPRLNKLFIISSASNLLVVADVNGKVESVHRLAPKLFPQPEGLTFNKTGDMYISNEGVTGKSTIHRFAFMD